MKTRWMCALSLAVAANSARGQVFIKAEDQGQGILRPRGGECFLLAPAHVLEGNSTVNIVSEFRRQATAKLETTYPGDLALLRIDSDTPIPCNEVWDAAAQLQARLTALPDAVVESRNEDGSLQRRSVRVTSYDPRLITVRSAVSQDRLFRGLSGSVLRIGGTPAGMLLRVDAETGDGVVLRADHMSDVTRSFFDQVVTEKPLAAAGLTIDPLDERAIVTERTSIQTLPDQLSPSAGALEVGVVVRVTGRVRERLWFRVTTGDGKVGFVPTRALQKLDDDHSDDPGRSR